MYKLVSWKSCIGSELKTLHVHDRGLHAQLQLTAATNGYLEVLTCSGAKTLYVICLSTHVHVWLGLVN